MTALIFIREHSTGTNVIYYRETYTCKPKRQVAHCIVDQVCWLDGYILKNQTEEASWALSAGIKQACTCTHTAIFYSVSHSVCLKTAMNAAILPPAAFICLKWFTSQPSIQCPTLHFEDWYFWCMLGYFVVSLFHWVLTWTIGIFNMCMWSFCKRVHTGDLGYSLIQRCLFFKSTLPRDLGS